MRAILGLLPPERGSVQVLGRPVTRGNELVGYVPQIRSAVSFSAHELNPLLGAVDRVLYLGGGHAALGTIDEVITGPVLSRLYGSEIEVAHLNGRIFVMSGQHEIERDHRRHEVH